MSEAVDKVVGKGGLSPLFSRLRTPLHSSANVRYVARAKPERKVETPEAFQVRTLGDLRIALILIAALAIMVFVHSAKDFLIPIVAALVLAACLAPLVNRLRRIIPSDSTAAAATILITLLALGGTAYLISDDVAVALEQLPEISRQFKVKMSLEPSTSNPVKKIAEAAKNIEEAASSMSGPVAAASTPEHVAKPEPVTPKPAWLRTQLLLGSTTLIQGLVQLSLALLIAFFILASGPMLRRKLLRASGTHRRNRARFRRILDQSYHQVQMYVLIVVVTNVAIGLVSWPLFYILGFEHSGLWALFAGLVHIVPYIGALLLAAMAAMFHYVTSPDVFKSVYIGLSLLVVASLVGTLLPTWLQSRTSRMNQFAVLVGILFWGWMWGLWGLFLGAPIVVVAKVICDNVSSLRGTARLLGD